MTNKDFPKQENHSNKEKRKKIMLLKEFMKNQADAIEKISFTCYGYKFSEEAFIDNSEEAENDMEIGFENMMYRIVIDGWIRDNAVITKMCQDYDIFFVECKVNLDESED